MQQIGNQIDAAMIFTRLTYFCEGDWTNQDSAFDGYELAGEMQRL
jgi:hypothetical protein